jgi:Kef-type K+ transport system membrane component KefB
VLIPLAAATEAANALADLAIVLIAAKIGDEIFKRIGQPTIIGEILAGLLVGPAVLGLVELGEVLEVFAELGVVFILFWVGLETRLHEMRAVGGDAARIGVTGVALPFAGGVAAGLALGESTTTSIFIGAALSATSVGITSAVLAELGVLRSRVARTILGAAVIDDILALILVAVAVGVAAEGGVDVTTIVFALLSSAAFVAFFALGGVRLMQSRPELLKAPKFSESPLLPAVILCLVLAALASEIGLASVIGAFLAGLIVAETKEQHPIEEEVEPLYAFFAPFFFASIGIQIDLDALADPAVLGLLALLTAVAGVTKFAGSWLAAATLRQRERIAVSLGMVPRGEVGIIVAGIGASAGVLDEELFAAIVGMSILTTLLVPPLLRRVL